MSAPTTTAPVKPGLRALLGRATLELDALALTASTAITALLGLAYWTIAARGFPIAEVGRASAIVSAATALATVSNLSLGGMYERFLPVTGRDTRRYLLRGGLATAGLAGLLGTIFVLVGPSDRLFTHDWERACFPLLVFTLAQFALLDNALVGLRRARWAAGKNVVHAVAKLGLAAAAAVLALAGGDSLVVAWAAPALLLVALYLPFVWRHCGTDTVVRVTPELPPRRELWSFFGSSVGIMVIGASAPLVIPLIVVDRLGPELNACFTMAWTLFSALALLLATVVGPYIAQASAPGADVRRLTARFAAILDGYDDPRLRVLRLRRTGLIGALNRGLDEARGAFIARLDADDEMLPGRLRRQLAAFRRNPELVACGSDYLLFGAAEGLVHTPRRDTDCRAHLVFGSPIAHPAVMLRGSALRAHGVRYREEYPHAEDFGLFSELAHVGTLANLAEPGLRYRVHPGQVSQVKAGPQRETHLRICAENLADRRVTVTAGQLESLLWPSGHGVAAALGYLLSRLPVLLWIGWRGHGRSGVGQALRVGRERLRSLVTRPRQPA